MNLSPVESLKRVLIVDDEEPLRFLFSMALDGESCSVDEAADGQAALKRLETECYDLVLLDLNMPGLSGIDVLEAMRARRDMTRVGIISAFIPGSAIVRAASLGVTSFLGKPMTLNFLREAVDESLLKHEESLLSRAHSWAAQLDFAKAFQSLKKSARPLNSIESLWMKLFEELSKGKSPAELSDLEPLLGWLVLTES